MILQHADVTTRSAHETGRALLSEMYEARFGREMPPICTGERGKPYFADGSAYFSITHTRHHVFCALADVPVGIDGEELDRDINLRLAEKILSPSERRRFEESADKRLALLKFWVLKEAQAKCTGLGLTGYPNHTDFFPEDPRIAIMNGCLVAVIQEER